MTETTTPIKIKTRPRRSTFGLSKEKDYLIENLSLLISAGLDIVASLNLLKSDIRSKAMKEIMDDIISEIESGSPLWQTLENSRLFPPYMIALIRIGEKSGKLSQNLKIVAKQDERDRSFRSQVRSAMMYPVFVFGFTLVVGIGVAWFILPRLATVFGSLKIKLPWITKILIDVGKWLGAHGTVAVPLIFLGCGALFYFIFVFPRTRFIGQKLLFKLPVIKRLLLELEMSRFGYLLGTLLEAGIPITSALDSLVEATSFPDYQKLYRHLCAEIEEGNNLQKSLASYRKISRFIPTPVQGMIAAGEQSGNIAVALLRIGENFTLKTETTAKNLTTLLEPLLLFIVWVGVMGVALAVFLPIYSLIGGLGGQIR
jgi:type IV pilus assembly protein PilC